MKTIGCDAFVVNGEGEIDCGQMATIGADVKVVFRKPGRLIIGDYCSIGPGVKFILDGGDVVLGDWTTLHDNCLVLSGMGVTVGEHCWFGQNSVLDGTGKLVIGNGVRVGMYSQIWTHVAAGEQIEGCTLFGTKPVVIEDEVWLVGSCVCSSGITIQRRTVALTGSNITKSWPAGTVLAGSPAVPKESLSFYREITLEEKWDLLIGWLKEAEGSLDIESVDGVADGIAAYKLKGVGERDLIVFARSDANAQQARQKFGDVTICSVSGKTYEKKLTPVEQKVLKFLSGNKARFYALPPT